VSLLVKVMGLYFLIKIVANVPLTALATAGVAGRHFVAHDVYRLSMILGLAILGGVLCVALIRGSDGVARRVCPPDERPVVPSGLSFGEWQALGASLIGLALLVSSLPPFVHTVVKIKMMAGLGAGLPELAKVGQYPVADLAALAVRIGVGLLLFVNPRGVTGAWARFRASRRFEDDGFEGA